MFYTVLAILLCLMVTPLVVSKSKSFSKKKAVRSVLINAISLGAIAVMFILSPFTAFAAETTEAVASKYGDFASGMGFLASAIVMGIASIGAGIAIAAAGSAAAGATGENPKVFGKVIVFVVLGEGIAIMAFVIAFLILNKI